MRKLLFTLLAISLFFTPLFPLFEDDVEGQDNLIPIQRIKSSLNHSLKNGRPWPSSIYYNSNKYEIHYTFDNELTQQIRRVLGKDSPNYAAVVVVDNNTGEILSAVDYNGRLKSFGHNMAFRSSHPAASIFKVVTAATLMEKSDISPETPFSFVGRPSTLFRNSQLGLDQHRRPPSRFVRNQKFKTAFAISNNVVFGKAAIKYLTFDDLYGMAKRVGFVRKDILQEVDLPPASLAYYENDEDENKVAEREEDYFQLAELASGFNKGTQMSPLHGVLLPLIVVNGGLIHYPYMIKEIVSPYTREKVWIPKVRTEKVLKSVYTNMLKVLMQGTIIEGTAKKSFRIERISKRGLLKKLDIGGKTGSITGGEPFGKRDWFVAYAKPRDPFSPHKLGISVAIMQVNTTRTVRKSSAIARDIFKYYYRELL